MYKLQTKLQILFFYIQSNLYINVANKIDCHRLFLHYSMLKWNMTENKSFCKTKAIQIITRTIWNKYMKLFSFLSYLFYYSVNLIYLCYFVTIYCQSMLVWRFCDISKVHVCNNVLWNFINTLRTKLTLERRYWKSIVTMPTLHLL